MSALSTLLRGGIPRPAPLRPLPSVPVRGRTRPRITRVGAELRIHGARKRFTGHNLYWLGLNANARDAAGAATWPTRAVVDAALDALLGSGGNLARVHTLGISVGNSQRTPIPRTIMPGLGSFDEAAFRQADMVIAAAAAKGVYLWVPTTDRWDYYHGGALTLARMVLGANATIGDFYANQSVINAHKAYLTGLLNRVNSVTGVRWGADPTIAFWETGNELWDAPRAWTVQIAAHLRSLAPNALIGDGSGASGLHVTAANVALTDPNIDFVSGHFYDAQRMDSAWVMEDAAAAAAAGKVYMIGEYDWTNASNNGSPAPPTSPARADFISTIENTINVSADLPWALLVPAAGQHRDRYEMYVPAENSEQGAAYADLLVHSAVMKMSPQPLPYSDSFTRGDSPSLDRTTFFTAGANGGSSAIQSNTLRLSLTGSNSGAGRVVVVPRTAAASNPHVDFDVAFSTVTAGSSLGVTLRAQTADASIDSADLYLAELSLPGRSISVSRRRSGRADVSMGASYTVPVFAANTAYRFEFVLAAASLEVRIWAPTDPRPPAASATWTGLSELAVKGAVGIVWSGAAGSSATATIDNMLLTDG